MMNEISIKTTLYHKILNLLCILILLGVFIFLIINWSSIPDKIPGHYDYSGAVNRWGEKNELWIIYIMGVSMYGGLSLVERFPKLWNTGVTVTLENKDRIYQLIKGMLITLKLELVIIFMFLTVYSVLLINLPWWFTPFYLVLIFGTMALYGIKLIKSR